MNGTIELSKEQMIAVKRGQIECEICGDLATPFVQLVGRGIYLWHDSIKGVYRSIKSQKAKDKIEKFYNEAYNISESETNVKLKAVQIVKLWIEGLSSCFEEMSGDYDVLRDIFNNTNTYFAIDQISQITHKDFINLAERVEKCCKGIQFVNYIDDKVQEVNNLYQMYGDKSSSVIYKLRMIKIIIEVLCSSFIYIENMEFA